MYDAGRGARVGNEVEDEALNEELTMATKNKTDKGAAAGATNETKPTDDKTPVVEPVSDNTDGMDREECLQKLQKKHPELVFAWADKERYQFRGNGWQAIRLTGGGTSFERVTVPDDADQTTGTILCVRTVEVDRRVRAKDEARRQELNARWRQSRNMAGQAGGINDALQMIGGGGVSASALTDKD